MDALRSATTAGLLAIRNGQLVWRHALTRDAVAGTLLPPERAVLARRAADALLDRGGAEDEGAAAKVVARARTGALPNCCYGWHIATSPVARCAARWRCSVGCPRSAPGPPRSPVIGSGC